MGEGAVALAAGMLAAVNPCGFALLPAYLSFLVLGDEQPAKSKAVARALTMTAAMTAGFAAVFGLFGLVIAPVAGGIQQHLPWFTVALGIVLAALGAWLLAGRAIPTIKLPTGNKAVSRSTTSMVLFGASYAIASIGCTIGPFIAIVVGSFRAGSPVEGIALFLAYAVGMGVTVGIAAVAVALARTTVVRGLRRAGAALNRIAGALMVVVGAYVAYYGWYEIRVLQGESPDDPVVGIGESLQRQAANALDNVGAPVIAGIAVLLAVTIGLTAWRRRAARAAGR